MSLKKNVSEAKLSVSQLLNQAKESLKILNSFEKETIAKARRLIKFPDATERRKMRDQRILSGLKDLGVATRNELHELELKIKKIESSLGKSSKKSSSHKSQSANK